MEGKSGVITCTSASSSRDSHPAPVDWTSPKAVDRHGTPDERAGPAMHLVTVCMVAWETQATGCERCRDWRRCHLSAGSSVCPSRLERRPRRPGAAVAAKS